MYKYRIRPSGLKYDLKVENPTWIKPGERLSPDTEFQPGVRSNPDGEFVKGNIPGNYKGDEVGYHGLHSWVYRNKGKPILCEHCGGEDNLQWANRSWKYMRELDDWLSLCVKCHKAYDREARGAMKERFG